MNSRFVASKLIQVLPRRQLSRWVGKLCEMPLPPAASKAVVEIYGRLYRVDTSEAEHRDTPYRSFDEFFTRPLRDSAREICDLPNEIASPADGMLQSVGAITLQGAIEVKRQHYDVERLVGDRALAEQLLGGQFAVVYLSPRDYHRVHAPVHGCIHQVIGISGELYPVNSVGEYCSPRLLQENQRVVIRIDTETMGPVVVVMVGALIVGRITVEMLPDQSNVSAGSHRIDPGWKVDKGQTIGTFHLGSTAVVLISRKAAANGVNTTHPIGPVKLGRSIMRLG